MSRRISNSEVQAWLTCQAQYRYAYDMAVAPKRYGDALSKGILFHEAIAEYYRTIGNGANADQALLRARKIISAEIAKQDEYTMEICIEVDKLMINYSSHYGTDPQWKVIEVETAYDLDMSEDYTMPMRLDLLVEVIATGEVLLVDTKTCYDFFSDGKIALYGQIPKYTGALRSNGHNVNGVLLNMVRTRKIKDPTPEQLWKRQKVNPSTAKVRNVLREHILASEEITAYRAKPDSVRPVVAKHVLNDFVCKYCSFQSLCTSELDGGDITHALKNDYRNNPYNYNTGQSDPSIMELL